MPRALDLTAADLSAEELAGATTATEAGRVGLSAISQRGTLDVSSRARLGRFNEQERVRLRKEQQKRLDEEKARLEREEKRAKRKRRLAEAFQIGGAILGAVIPGASLATSAFGAQIGGAVGTAVAGRQPGAASQQLPGLLTGLESFRTTQRRRTKVGKEEKDILDIAL